MYYEDDSGTSSEQSSGISSIDSNSSIESKSDESSEGEFDEDSLSIIKIKIALEKIMKDYPSQFRLSEDDDENMLKIQRNIADVVNVIKNFDRPDNLNGDLTVLAGYYDLLYKGIVNENNITTFINNYASKASVGTKDPMDIIRYITAYINHKPK